ncbi:MAG: nucleoside deaminase [Syntrophomonadaceae bacterium]|jgi:guanine deaminase|nr:nucleoside deaminase [Syntrophomonadaceae bacterium]
MNKFMKIAYDEAEKGMRNSEGGPFGAVIADQEGRVISQAHNQVLARHDPTAHAEIQALRIAGQVKKTHDMRGCVLYTTCEPCPMCLSAVIWANITEVVYACDRQNADDIGFRDARLYEFFKKGRLAGLNFQQMDKEECLRLFIEYKNKNMEIY